MPFGKWSNVINCININKQLLCKNLFWNNFKGNAQFLFFCNPLKSGALRVCVTFPEITQKY